MMLRTKVIIEHIIIKFKNAHTIPNKSPNSLFNSLRMGNLKILSNIKANILKAVIDTVNIIMYANIFDTILLVDKTLEINSPKIEKNTHANIKDSRYLHRSNIDFIKPLRTYITMINITDKTRKMSITQFIVMVPFEELNYSFIYFAFV